MGGGVLGFLGFFLGVGEPSPGSSGLEVMLFNLTQKFDRISKTNGFLLYVLGVILPPFRPGIDSALHVEYSTIGEVSINSLQSPHTLRQLVSTSKGGRKIKTSSKSSGIRRGLEISFLFLVVVEGVERRAVK